MKFISPISFSVPEAFVPSAWIEHAPFAFWLIESLKPRVLVELGAHHGFSYFCFCQTIQRLSLETRAYAVDTWRGDEHAGLYGEEVFEQIKQYHDERYTHFSQLIRSTFDDAVNYFEDGTIDLLHIDGRHLYGDIRNDFEKWLPKVSSRGVVLFHDTNVRERGFGVYKFWEEITEAYPAFEFIHGHGLGVLGVGPDLPDQLKELLTAPPEARGVRAAYAKLGAAISTQALIAPVQQQCAALAKDNASVQCQLLELNEQLSQSAAAVASLTAQKSSADDELLQLQQRCFELTQENEATRLHQQSLNERLARLEAETAASDERAAACAAESTALESRLEATAAALAAQKSSADDEILQLQQRCLELAQENETVHLQQQALSEQLAQLEAAKAVSDERAAERVVLETRLDAATACLAAQKSAAADEIAHLNIEKNTFELLAARLTAENDSLSELASRLSKEKDAAVAQLSSLTPILKDVNTKYTSLLAWAEFQSDLIKRARKRPIENLRRYLTWTTIRSAIRLRYCLPFSASSKLQNAPVRYAPDAEWEIFRWATNTNPLDCCWYLEQYPDVRDSGIDPLVHYVQWGAEEGRLPSPRFGSSAARGEKRQSWAMTSRTISTLSTAITQANASHALTYACNGSPAGAAQMSLGALADAGDAVIVNSFNGLQKKSDSSRWQIKAAYGKLIHAPRDISRWVRKSRSLRRAGPTNGYSGNPYQSVSYSNISGSGKHLMGRLILQFEPILPQKFVDRVRLRMAGRSPTKNGSSFAQGHIEAAASFPLGGGVVIVGWELHCPNVEIWIEDERGASYSLENAFRLYRQDITDIASRTPWRPSSEPGFVAYLPDTGAAKSFRLIAALSTDVQTLSEARATTLGPEPRPAAEWLFGVGTPLSDFHKRIPIIDEPALTPLINHSRAVWDKLPTRVERFGKTDDVRASIITPLFGRWDFVEHQLIKYAEDPWLRQHAELIYVVDDPALVETFGARVEALYNLYQVPFRWIWGGMNRGFSGANNLGVRHSHGEYLVFVNSDVFPQQCGWLETLINVLERQPEIGAVGPRLVFPDGKIQHAGMEFVHENALGVWLNDHPYKGADPSADPHQTIAIVPAVTGACLAVRRSDLDRIGGWDTGYLIGDFEDSDLCLKLYSHNLLSAYVPSVQLVHLERQSFKILGEGDFRTKVTLFNAYRHQTRWVRRLNEFVSACES